MGVNKTSPVRDGEAISADAINQFDSALKGDHVPRDSTGSAATGAGSVGTPSLTWANGYFNRLFVGGIELGGEGGEGGAAINPDASIRNGVVRGLEPANRPGMCGWLRQAGSGGVSITASSTNPLVVKLDGISYQRESNITGGTLPSNNTTAAPIITGYNSIYSLPDANVGRPAYRTLTGAIVDYRTSSQQGTNTPVPAAHGDVFIIRRSGSQGTGYSIYQRHYNEGGNPQMKLGVGQSLNTSPTAYAPAAFAAASQTNLSDIQTYELLRTGYIFTDPLTSTWALTISKRVVGSADAELPATTGYDAGDVVFLELDQRWYRLTGGSWQKTSLVFLGIAAIRNGAVEAVEGVRSEDALIELYNKKFAILGEPIMREGVADAGGDNVYFGGDTSGDIEGKGTAELIAQSLDKVGTDAVINIDDDGTKANNTLFCAYLNADDNTYFYEEVAPQWLLYRDRLLLTHPNRHAIYVGCFAFDGSGNLITRWRIGNDSNRHRLSENNDDTWLVNPQIWPRARVVRTPGRPRFEYRVRQSSGQPETYILRGHSFWGNVRTATINRVLYEDLSPFVPQEQYFDTDASAGDGDMGFELSLWGERDLLTAVGLSASGREGEKGLVGEGIGAADEGFATGSVPGGAIAEGGIGQAQLDQQAVTADKMEIAGTPADDDVISWDATNSRLAWSTGGGGGTPADGSITYAKMASSAIATEADIFDNPTSNTELVANKTLADAFAERDRQLGAFWSSWASLATTSFASVAASGTRAIEGFGDIEQRNTSEFNALTSTLTDGTLYICGTSVASAGLPTLTSGTLRGGLLFLDTAGTRWFYPIDNPESPDGEEFYRASGGSWAAVGYKGDELRVHVQGLPDDGSWNPFAAHHIGGPGSAINAFNGETLIARRSGEDIAIVRAVYDTTDNEFDILVSSQEFEIPVTTDDLPAGTLVYNGTPTNDQIPVYNTANTRWQLEAKPSGGGGGGASATDIVGVFTATDNSSAAGANAARIIADELTMAQQEMYARTWGHRSTGTATFGSSFWFINVSNRTGSAYNTKTGSASDSSLAAFSASNATNMPTLSSGTLLGGFVFYNVGDFNPQRPRFRWLMPLVSGTQADDEKFFYLNASNEWVGVGENSALFPWLPTTFYAERIGCSPIAAASPALRRSLTTGLTGSPALTGPFIAQRDSSNLVAVAKVTLSGSTLTYAGQRFYARGVIGSNSIDSQVVNTTMIRNGTIVDADISSSAAIAQSKLAALTATTLHTGSSAWRGGTYNAVSLGTRSAFRDFRHILLYLTSSSDSDYYVELAVVQHPERLADTTSGELDIFAPIPSVSNTQTPTLQFRANSSGNVEFSSTGGANVLSSNTRINIVGYK